MSKELYWVAKGDWGYYVLTDAISPIAGWHYKTVDHKETEKEAQEIADKLNKETREIDEAYAREYNL